MRKCSTLQISLKIESVSVVYLLEINYLNEDGQ